MTEGLSSKEAGIRLRKFGKNQISKEREQNFFDIILEEIREPMILLLLAVGIFYSVFGEFEDTITIFIVIFFLILAEVWNEYRAKKAIFALSKITAPKAKLIRDRKITEVDSEDVVPGDIILLIPGTKVSADSKILVSYGIQADESSLTGESFPKEKKAGDTIFAGTIIVSGEGKAEVFATGKNTKMGEISSMTKEATPPKTPFQISMKTLANSLVKFSIFFSVLITVFGMAQGRGIEQMFLIGLSVAFVIIPEELPIIITMVLGLGSYKLSQQKFLVKKLRAAETLGDATVIVTDKTGTITESKMKIAKLYPEKNEKEIIQTAIYAMSDYSLSSLDMSIIEYGKKLKLKSGDDIIKERNIGNGRKTKSVIRKINNSLFLFSTGSPEEIFQNSKKNNKFQEKLDEEVSKGRRVIAVARKAVINYNPKSNLENLEKNMDIIGIISFEDPARKGVRETVEKLKNSGVKTIMVTGDHPKTAQFIAKSIGISSEKVMLGEQLDKLSDKELKETVNKFFVFARATPENKYRIVKALQENGEVVAVTGDGINDIIALKQADIGISMGIRGADAAKEQSDAVLADDNYITISHALYEGRKFFDNLKKGVKYYLSVKLALILIFLIPIFLNLPLPFSPIQIIALELFMDLAASSAFVFEPEEKNIYSRKPRNIEENIINKQMILGILKSGLSLFAAAIIVYSYALYNNYPLILTQTLVFSTWITGHVFLAFVTRSEKEPIYKIGIFSNKVILLWTAAAFIFLFTVLNINLFGAPLKITSISINQYLVVFAVSFALIFWQELGKILGEKI